MLLKILVLIAASLCIAQCSPLSVGERKIGVNARKYLFTYGYKDTYSENEPEEALVGSIKLLQHYANLPLTGRLDDATLTQMTFPRCGHRDPRVKIETNGKTRRYIHQGSSWKPLFEKNKNQILKWTLINKGRTLDYDTVLITMRKAFNYWSEKTNIDFEEVPKELVGTTEKYDKNNIEILVSFVRGWHEDPYAFDGQGGTLAHAYYPGNNVGLNGDVHFDDAEEYTYESPQGRNLLWVATHELGHSIGMEHSNIQEAVMYPWYTEYKPGFQLNADDVAGIQALYGVRQTPLSTTTTTTEPPPPFTIITTTTSTTTTTQEPPEPKIPEPKIPEPKIPEPEEPVIIIPDMILTTTEEPATTTEEPETTTEEPTTTSTTTTTKSTTTTTKSTTTKTTTKEPTTTEKPTTTEIVTRDKMSTTVDPAVQTTETIKTTTSDPPRPSRVCRPADGKLTAIYYSDYYRQHVAYTTKHKFLFLGYKRSIPVLSRLDYIPKSTIPDMVDAITDATRHTQMVFAGSNYYIYNDFTYESGPFSIDGKSKKNPMRIRFPQWVKKIDAAMKWYRNKRTYFFSGQYYWRYNNVRKTFDRGYPKKIKKEWKGLPGKIDAAFSSPLTKKTFFIVGKKYYDFNDEKIKVRGVYHVNDFMRCNGQSIKNVSIGKIVNNQTNGRRKVKP